MISRATDGFDGVLLTVRDVVIKLGRFIGGFNPLVTGVAVLPFGVVVVVG